MAQKKIDGVIEAVRYSPDGNILLARLYERRGVVWSDHVLMGRKDLVERLHDGKRFVTGERKPTLGSVFETGPKVQLEHEHIITVGQTTARDLLVGASVF